MQYYDNLCLNNIFRHLNVLKPKKQSEQVAFQFRRRSLREIQHPFIQIKGNSVLGQTNVFFINKHLNV